MFKITINIFPINILRINVTSKKTIYENRNIVLHQRVIIEHLLT
jgi:hypothetical protein